LAGLGRLRNRFPAAACAVSAVLLALVLSAAARADEAWRKDWRVFRVGLLPSGDAEAFAARIEPFRKAMETALRIPVRIVPMATFDELIRAQARLRVHYAIYSTSAYATASVGCRCVRALAAPITPDGVVGFHALILAGAKSRMKGIGDLKELRLALGRRGSLAGDLAPLTALRGAGLNPGSDVELVYSGSPLKAVAALKAGKADAAVAWSSLFGSKERGYSRGTLRALVGSGGKVDDYTIVWKSPTIPHGPHAVQTVVPPELRELLTNFLTGLRTTSPVAYEAVDPVHGGGFARIGHAAYQPVIDMLTRKAGR